MKEAARLGCFEQDYMLILQKEVFIERWLPLMEVVGSRGLMDY